MATKPRQGLNAFVKEISRDIRKLVDNNLPNEEKEELRSVVTKRINEKKNELKQGKLLARKFWKVFEELEKVCFEIGSKRKKGVYQRALVIEFLIALINAHRRPAGSSQKIERLRERNGNWPATSK